MKLSSRRLQVGDCVVIPVPKVDRGPANSPNVIGVVIAQKNKLNRLGNEHGKLKGFWKYTTNYIKVH
jgi:hypothetical protein